MQEMFKNEVYKMIVSTRFGAVPFLNDALLSSFNSHLFNVKLCDLKNYFEVFEKFKSTEHKFLSPGESVINKYFQLSCSYLTFLDYKDFNDSLGLGEENALFYISITGKSKINFQEYFKIINTLNPDLVLIPFEYISPDCSLKRQERSFKKINKFIEMASKTGKKNYICPLFLYHINKYNLPQMNKDNIFAGYSIILEEYKKLDLEKVLMYQKELKNLNLSEDSLKIKCGTGHPSKPTIYS